MLFGILIILLAGFIGGQNTFFIKIALREFPPLFIVLIRSVIAAFIFLPFFLKEKNKFTKSDYKRLGGIAIFFFGNFGINGIATQYTSTIVTQTLYTLS